MSMTGDPSIMSNPLMFNMFPLISNSWTTVDPTKFGLFGNLVANTPL